MDNIKQKSLGLALIFFLMTLFPENKSTILASFDNEEMPFKTTGFVAHPTRPEFIAIYNKREVFLLDVFCGCSVNYFCVKRDFGKIVSLFFHPTLNALFFGTNEGVVYSMPLDGGEVVLENRFFCNSFYKYSYFYLKDLHHPYRLCAKYRDFAKGGDDIICANLFGIQEKVTQKRSLFDKSYLEHAQLQEALQKKVLAYLQDFGSFMMVGDSKPNHYFINHVDLGLGQNRFFVSYRINGMFFVDLFSWKKTVDNVDYVIQKENFVPFCTGSFCLSYKLNPKHPSIIAAYLWDSERGYRVCIYDTTEERMRWEYRVNITTSLQGAREVLCWNCDGNCLLFYGGEGVSLRGFVF